MQSALTRNGSACTPNHWGLPGQLPTLLLCSILAPPLPCTSCARDGGVSPRSNTCSRRRKSFRRDAPPHQGVRRHTRLETPVWEDKEPSERRTWLQECRGSGVPCQAGWKPSAARRVCDECVAHARQLALRREGPAGRGSPGPLPATSSASAERSCQLSSAGTALRVYMRNHMVTSSSWWATRRVTSSAVELPHRCEMQCGGGRSKAGCSGAWLPRQQAAEQ